MDRLEWTVALRQKLEKKKLILERHCIRECSAHDHLFLELTYILRGPVEHERDGRREILHTGDYFIVDYGSVHGYRAPEGESFENLDCLFLPELLDPVLRGTKSLRVCLEHYLLRFHMNALRKDPCGVVFHDEGGTVRELLEKMEAESVGGAPGYLEFLRCYLLEILLHTMRTIAGDEQSATEAGISPYIHKYVEEHYGENISLSDLAERMHYSLPYVSRRFREENGVSFLEYLQNYRVMQGCRLLLTSDYTTAQIARAVGYRDVKFFSELVRRITGLAPSYFRKNAIK